MGTTQVGPRKKQKQPQQKIQRTETHVANFRRQVGILVGQVGGVLREEWFRVVRRVLTGGSLRDQASTQARRHRHDHEMSDSNA
jgi:hypothetical protein